MKKLMILAAVMALAGTAYARCPGGKCPEENGNGNGSRCTEGRCIAPDSFDQGTSRGWGHYQGNDRQQKQENGKANGRNRRLFRAKKNTSNNQRQTRSRGFPLQMKQKTQS